MSDLSTFAPQLLSGLLLTIKLATASVAIGSPLGLLVAVAKMSPSALVRALAYGFANLFRALPELLVVLTVYFGVQQAVDRMFGQGLEISPFMAGAASLSLMFAAYASEVFRAAYLAIPQGQVEAARAFGMTEMRILRRIRLPQMLRIALPSLGNLWLGLLKDTSLVAVIGLNELMRNAQIATSVTKAPYTFYGAAALLYILVSMLSSALLRRLELWRGLGPALAA
jgi:His/Glu/Gln/Arg/opine family amino acid ABC transporter permease subunit